VSAPTGPLAGLRVLDLSRILAGPSATMLMADMGAHITKIERPRSGDDTRRYAPPYLQKGPEQDSDISAYFASCNRNKHSVALNFTTGEGQQVVRHLLQESQVLVENFKTGTLDKYGLGHKQLREEFPGLIYCSITGFGNTGPYKDRPAYDMLIQAMGGSMSITGVPDGEPMKMGLSMFDLTAGLHAVIGILAALRHKSQTGIGQHVDISMLDVSIALLQNQGMNFLAKKQRQARVGNSHPNVVPYQVMPSRDDYFILTASNDEQFEKFCKVAAAEELLQDGRFRTMKARVVNRVEVTERLNEITGGHTTNWWLQELEKAGVGCAPILHLDEVFADPQVRSRDMMIQMAMPGFQQPVNLIGSPLKFSRTKVNYRLPPPRLGEHTDPVLLAAGFTEAEIEQLRVSGAVGEAPQPMEMPTPPLTTATPTVSGDKESDLSVGPLLGSTWDSVRSTSVPNASAYLSSKPASVPRPRSKLRGRAVGGGTWDSVRSMSVPNASAFMEFPLGEDAVPPRPRRRFAKMQDQSTSSEPVA